MEARWRLIHKRHIDEQTGECPNTSSGVAALPGIPEKLLSFEVVAVNRVFAAAASASGKGLISITATEEALGRRACVFSN